jgi:hypothetical protein
MKIPSTVAATLCLTTNNLTYSFPTQPTLLQSIPTTRQKTQLYSVAPRQSEGRTTKEIAKELSRGITLDGGPVIDFASVKDSTSL